VNDTFGSGGTPQPPEGTIENDWIFGPGAAVAGGAVVGGLVVGGEVAGGFVVGAAVAAVVGAGIVVTAAPPRVVAVSVATDVVVSPVKVVSADSREPDVVELHAPSSVPVNTSEAARAVRTRRFDMGRAYGSNCRRLWYQTQW
jgi:hypothetical protein